MLSKDQLDSFQRDGFLVIDAVLDAADLEPLQQEYAALLDEIAGRLYRQGEIDSDYAELDFGERLFAEGGDRCQKFNPFATLTGDQIIFNDFEFNKNLCDADSSMQRLFSVAGVWRVSVKKSQYLILENTESILMYKRDDWR